MRGRNPGIEGMSAVAMGAGDGKGMRCCPVLLWGGWSRSAQLPRRSGASRPLITAEILPSPLSPQPDFHSHVSLHEARCDSFRLVGASVSRLLTSQLHSPEPTATGSETSSQGLRRRSSDRPRLAQVSICGQSAVDVVDTWHFRLPILGL